MTMTMTNHGDRAAIGRWADDGGAPAVRRPSPDDAAALERLGQAVVEDWAALPTTVRRSLFRSALAGAGPEDGDRSAGPLARRVARVLRGVRPSGG